MLASLLIPVFLLNLSSVAMPTTDEFKVMQALNKERSVRGLKPMLPIPDLCEFNRVEMEKAVTDKKKAKGREKRLKATGLVPNGHSSMVLWADDVNDLIKKIKKDKRFEQRIRMELSGVAVGIFNVPAQPPFIQAAVVFIKGKPVDPCGGKPGLSEATVASVKSGATAKVQQCYNELMKRNPNISGSIIFSIVVGTNGKISSRRLLRSDDEIKGMVICVEKVLDKLTFPKPCGTKPVTIASFGWNLQSPHKERIGYLSQGQINGGIQRKRPQIQRCYENELKKGKKFNGTITLHFVVNGKGDIQKVTVKEDTLNSKSVLNCVKEITNMIIFPAPKWNGKVEFDYPLHFAPKN